MNLNLFDQFAYSTLFNIPLVLIALMAPWLLFSSSKSRWLKNRLEVFQLLLTKKIAKEIFNPLKMPAQKWSLMYTSLMVFLLGMNILGLLPYTFTPTTQLSLSLGFAVPLWLSTVMIGLRNQPSLSLAHLLPEGTPSLLIPILILIETVSLLIRPLALGVRLTANLTAGHLLIQLLSMATLYANWMPISLLTFSALILLTLLEIAVAIIQAYVFVLLLSLYLQENT